MYSLSHPTNNSLSSSNNVSSIIKNTAPGPGPCGKRLGRLLIKSNNKPLASIASSTSNNNINNNNNNLKSLFGTRVLKRSAAEFNNRNIKQTTYGKHNNIILSSSPISFEDDDEIQISEIVKSPLTPNTITTQIKDIEIKPENTTIKPKTSLRSRIKSDIKGYTTTLDNNYNNTCKKLKTEQNSEIISINLDEGKKTENPQNVSPLNMKPKVSLAQKCKEKLHNSLDIARTNSISPFPVKLAETNGFSNHSTENILNSTMQQVATLEESDSMSSSFICTQLAVEIGPSQISQWEKEFRNNTFEPSFNENNYNVSTDTNTASSNKILGMTDLTEFIIPELPPNIPQAIFHASEIIYPNTKAEKLKERRDLENKQPSRAPQTDKQFEQIEQALEIPFSQSPKGHQLGTAPKQLDSSKSKQSSPNKSHNNIQSTCLSNASVVNNDTGTVDWHLSNYSSVESTPTNAIPKQNNNQCQNTHNNHMDIQPNNASISLSPLISDTQQSDSIAFQLPPTPATVNRPLTLMEYQQQLQNQAQQDLLAERHALHPSQSVCLQPYISSFLPEFLATVYNDNLSISKLFDWQFDCLKTVLKNESHLIYTASTSAGKTLVAEILMFRRIFSQSSINNQCLFIVPFNSILHEKYNYFKSLVKGLKFNFTYDSTTNRAAKSYIKIKNMAATKLTSNELGYNTDIAILTIEKGNQILNNIIMNEEYYTRIGCVVIDEFHMLGDENRGYIIEDLVTKIKFMEKNREKYYNDNPNLDISKLAPCQIIGMSATLPNAVELADYLSAQVYTTQSRPVTLTERLKYQLKLYDYEGKVDPIDGILIFTPNSVKGNIAATAEWNKLLKRDSDRLGFLCSEQIFCKGSYKEYFQSNEHHSNSLNSELNQVIVFCPERKICTQVCEKLCDLLPIYQKLLNNSTTNNDTKVQRDNLITKLKSSPFGCDPLLERCISLGIAPHHAGLNEYERSTIEYGYRNSFISILAATTTISAGVNFATKLVIFYSLRVGYNEIDITQYKQSAGRAGRINSNNLRSKTEGKSIIFCNTEEEKRKALSLINAKPKPIKSSLIFQNETKNNTISHTSQRNLSRLLLQSISIGLCSDHSQFLQLMQCTFYYYQLNQSNSVSFNRNQKEISELCNVYILTALKELHNSNLLDFKSCDLTQQQLVSSKLGLAVLNSSFDPQSAVFHMNELSIAREELILLSDVHLLYYLIPVNSIIIRPNWFKLAYIVENFDNPIQLNIAKLLGIHIGTIHNYSNYDDAMLTNKSLLSTENLPFYKYNCALILNDLINETIDISTICNKYGIESPYLLYLLRKETNLLGCMLISLCNTLSWNELSVVLASLNEKIAIGLKFDSVSDDNKLYVFSDIPSLKNRERAVQGLIKANINSTLLLAQSSAESIYNIIHHSRPFQSEEDTLKLVQRDQYTAMRIVKEAQFALEKQNIKREEEIKQAKSDLKQQIQNNFGLNSDRNNVQGFSSRSRRKINE